MIEVTFKKITGIKEAEATWQALSPKLSLFDDWNFRMCFHKYYKKEINFYAGYVGDELIGLLPLQHNDTGDYLEFWCGSYMEDNRLFIKPGFEQYIESFYTYIKTTGKKVRLEYISGTDSFTTSLPVQEHKFILPLTSLQNYGDYLTNFFQAHGRKKMRKKIKDVEAHTIEIKENNFSDIEKLFEFNISMFGSDSSFINRPYHKEIFREILNLPFSIHLLSFFVDKELQGVSLAVHYKNGYFYLSPTTKIDGVENLMTYVNIKNIDRAIQIKAEFFDALAGNYGWKEPWHLAKKTLYKFEAD